MEPISVKAGNGTNEQIPRNGDEADTDLTLLIVLKENLGMLLGGVPLP